jgi:hypothetical protein
MAGTGVGKFSSTASNNTSNLTVNFAENMAPSNVNNAARELMGHMRDMYEQLGDGYFEFGDGDGTYTVARGDADTITITSASDISSVYFPGRKIRITDGGANVVEGTIASSSHASTTQTVNLTGITLASGTPTKVELGIDTAAFGGKIILDDDGDTYIEAPTDDTIDIYVAGAKDFVITANTFTAESGSTIAAQALTATTVTASGIVKTDDATEATSTTDGSLQTDGGLSVVKDAVFGDDIKLLSDSAVIHFGADGDVTLTHDHNVGLILATEGVANSLAIVSGDDGATGGPTLNLKRDSASPADDDIIGIINFTGRNDNSQDVIGFQIDNFCRDVSDGAEENITRFKNMFNGTLTEFMRADSQSDQAVITFNELSNDIDFRVESNGNTHMLMVNGGSNLVGIGADPDLGAGLHIKTADTGASVDGNADELVIEGTRSGLSILSANNDFGYILFGDDGSPNIGSIRYGHSANDLRITVGGNESMVIASTGETTHTASINDVLLYLKNTATSGNVFGQQINFSSTANDTGSYFFRCLGNNNSTVRAAIYSNGDFDSATNSYGATSDERIKQNITDANSQWDDIKGLRVRNFKFKDEARTEANGGQAAKTYLGLVAQEAETVSPGLIKEKNPEKADILSSSEFGTLYTADDSETQDAVLYTSDDQEVIDGDKNVGDIKTPSTKQIGEVKTITEQVKSVSYSVLYMKAIKALQEAMTKIEDLEARVTTLEG